jgi:hypothetical protein
MPPSTVAWVIYHYWLVMVGGLEHGWIMTFHILGRRIPFDELHDFLEG